MLRTIFGIIVGIAAWFAVALGIAFVIRATDPSLNATLVAHTTTVAQWERLAISFLASIIGGWLAALVAGERARAPLIAGVLLLVIFVPYHLYGSDPQGRIWTSFPLWYHLTFFVSLVLLSVLGGRLKRA